MARSIDNRYRILGSSALLFCLALFLTSYSSKNPRIASIGGSVLQQLLYPFQLGSSSVHSTFSDLWGHYIALVSVQRENESLRSRVEALESQNAKLEEVAKENERLQKLLKVVEDTSLETMPAHVIGYDATNWIQAVSIDKGTRHGLHAGMAVMGATGVVGQIVAASISASKVLLLTDNVSGIDAIVQGNRARGIVEGAGDGYCHWRFVSEPDEVKIGDKLVTSGADGVYPKGLLVGVVTDIQDRGKNLSPEIKIEPAQDLDRLETVLVVLGTSLTNVKTK